MDIYTELLLQKISEYVMENPEFFEADDISLLTLTCQNFPGVDELLASESPLVSDLIANASAYLFGGCNGFSDQAKPEGERLAPDVLTILDNALYKAAEVAAQTIKESK